MSISSVVQSWGTGPSPSGTRKPEVLGSTVWLEAGVGTWVQVSKSAVRMRPSASGGARTRGSGHSNCSPWTTLVTAPMGCGTVAQRGRWVVALPARERS